ncbi:glucosaminidase domain-containing protein [Cohnella nanjingensis]|uniref:glucosaminidase domain-containing protein n=1 Tax=Cohnella nanjingensis TaxID=1387779 RepID=UPI0028AB72D0|nr:glucosaminidase domain-containing protein [Cohnella nanjingensis]
MAEMQRCGVPASLTIAQAALESAWGMSGLTLKANNLFGIKGVGPAGSVTMSTTEYSNGQYVQVPAAFRAYRSWTESISDHSNLLLKPRYVMVLRVDGPTAAKAVAAAGYATDPKYAGKLIELMDDHCLHQYDKGEEEMEKVTVIVDGVKIKDGLFDAKTGTSYVPSREYGEALGARSVDWDGKSRTVNVVTK